MHRPSADLDAAVAFVVERISQEAEHSAVPLDDDETHFLNQLPSEPRSPTAALASGFNTAYEYFWPTPVLRDLRFQRLCKWQATHTRTILKPAQTAYMNGSLPPLCCNSIAIPCRGYLGGQASERRGGQRGGIVCSWWPLLLS